MAKPIEKGKRKYMEYVQKKLKKFRVDDPAKVPNKHKKKFYDELDKGWESKEEKEQKREKKQERKHKKRAKIIEAVLNKIAPKQPPKGWWDMMRTKIRKDSPEYSEKVLDKVVGEIWYNKMAPDKKKDVVTQYES